MKITKINLYKYSKPFMFKFHNTQMRRANAESIIIQLECDEGFAAYGESTPMAYITGEDYSTVVQVIRNYFSPILFSQDVKTIDDVDGILTQLESVCRIRNIFHYNSALGAVDLALLDALGKLRQVPMIGLLGSAVRKKASYSVSIPFLPLQKIRKLFAQIPGLAGVKYVKVLVGEDERRNIERVRVVRSLFGDHADIRVENNGKWTFRQAVSNLEKLRQFNITAVEQPLEKDDVKGLHMLRKAIGIPVIADESMCSLSDAMRLIENESCDILNIKISKCGGLLRSKQIANFAEAQNIQCQMGAHVGETEILREAGKSFALTTSNLIYFEGCSFLLFEDSWRGTQFDITIDRKDEIPGFGLGVRLADQQSIMKHCSLIAELPG
jgi:muconate cycloisomerase